MIGRDFKTADASDAVLPLGLEDLLRRWLDYAEVTEKGQPAVGDAYRRCRRELRRHFGIHDDRLPF
jgi:hypothetical protein